MGCVPWWVCTLAAVGAIALVILLAAWWDTAREKRRDREEEYAELKKAVEGLKRRAWHVKDDGMEWFASCGDVGESRKALGDELRSELRALASALGYEWVPEGKTKAEWRKREAAYDKIVWGDIPCGLEGCFGRQIIVTPKRRKGDKKGGRK